MFVRPNEYPFCITIQDEHEWLDGECDHEVLTGPPNDPEGNELQYFAQGEPALQALRKLV